MKNIIRIKMRIITGLLLSILLVVPAYASRKPDPVKLDRSALAGDLNERILQAAYQQEANNYRCGYVGKKLNGRNLTSAFVNWRITGKTSTVNKLKYADNWCSEFANWCYNVAGVSPLFNPRWIKNTDSWKNQYAKFGQFYLLEGGVSNGGLLATAEGKKLKVSQLRKGDIIQIGTGLKLGHTAIFVRASGNTIYTIDGNIGSENTTSGTGVKKRKYSAGIVMGVCRPLLRGDICVKLRKASKKDHIAVVLQGLHSKNIKYLITIPGTGLNRYPVSGDKTRIQLSAKKYGLKKGKTYRARVEIMYKNTVIGYLQTMTNAFSYNG